jgi:hypothetical protein
VIEPELLPRRRPSVSAWRSTPYPCLPAGGRDSWKLRSEEVLSDFASTSEQKREEERAMTSATRSETKQPRPLANGPKSSKAGLGAVTLPPTRVSARNKECFGQAF